MIIYFLIAKFLAYVGVCFFVHRFFLIDTSKPLRFSLSWAAARFCIGLMAALFLYLAFDQLHKLGLPDAVSYILSFGIIRYFEWLLLFGLIKFIHDIPFGRKAQLFVFTGTAVSLLFDWVAVLIGLHKMRFFC
jgi:hypothetical protein